MDLKAAAAELQRTHIPEMGPAQLEVSNVAVALDEAHLDSRQVVYVDVRCGTDLFRTTAQARKFDPLAPKNGPLAFDTDRGTMAVPTPLGADDMLQLSVRRCQIFGDSDLCAVSVPVAALPLVKEVKCHFKVGRFVFTVLPVNIGMPPEAPGAGRGSADAPLALTEAVHEMTYDDVRLTAASRGGAKKHGRRSKANKNRSAAATPAVAPYAAGGSALPIPAGGVNMAAFAPNTAKAPAGTGDQQSVSPPKASVRATAGAAAEDDVDSPTAAVVTLRPRESADVDGASPPAADNTGAPREETTTASARSAPAAPLYTEGADGGVSEAHGAEGSESEGEEEECVPRGFPGMDDPSVDEGPLEIIRNDDSLKPLWYKGALPTAAPEIPVGYRRSLRLRGLLSPASHSSGGGSSSSGGGGIKSLFGAVTSAVANAVTDVSTVVELEMMRGHFPHIRAPLVHAYSPQVLNGHGTPIEGSLFITTKEVAFHGPLLQFEVAFDKMLHVRRTLSFGRDCIQLFCPGHVVYQLQGLDGIVARFGSAIGVREHTKFYQGYCLIVDLWRTAKGLPAPPVAA